jgi:methionyl-tRNA synthetase
VERAREGYSQLDFSSSCDVILNIASAGNVYMNDRTPWSLFKQGALASNEASQVFPPMFPIISDVLHK